MLSKIPMELIRRAQADLDRLRELCELLRPHVGPLLGLLSQHSSGSGQTEALFVSLVITTVQAHEFGAVDKEGNLTGLPLASFMLDLKDAAVRMERRLADSKSRARPASSTRAGSPQAVLGGGGDDPSALPLSVYFDLSTTPPDQIVDLLVALSDLYRSVGGDGLAIRTVGTMQPALIPAGV